MKQFDYLRLHLVSGESFKIPIEYVDTFIILKEGTGELLHGGKLDPLHIIYSCDIVISKKWFQQNEEHTEEGFYTLLESHGITGISLMSDSEVLNYYVYYTEHSTVQDINIHEAFIPARYDADVKSVRIIIRYEDDLYERYMLDS